MTYHFARQQPDGRISSPLSQVYATEEAAIADAPEALRHLRVRGGAIVLVQVIKEVVPTFKIDLRDPKTVKEFTGKV